MTGGAWGAVEEERGGRATGGPGRSGGVAHHAAGKAARIGGGGASGDARDSRTAPARTQHPRRTRRRGRGSWLHLPQLLQQRVGIRRRASAAAPIRRLGIHQAAQLIPMGNDARPNR
ncbi:MAG: hypothetical protein ACK56F_19340 [bacterium]